MSTHKLRFTLNGQTQEASVPAHRRLIDLGNVHGDGVTPHNHVGDIRVFQRLGGPPQTIAYSFFGPPFQCWSRLYLS